MVVHKTIFVNDLHVPHMVSNYKSTAPKHVTKTKRDYYWFLPVQFDTLVTRVS